MTGTLPSQDIRALLQGGVIRAGDPEVEARVQPASLDLALGAEAWVMPGSLLPLAGERIEALLEAYAHRRVDLSTPQILQRGHVYVARLSETLALPAQLAAYANAKSSIGRIDVLARVLTDGNPRYDKVSPGYEGRLYIEIVPKSFDVVARAGDTLSQMIFYGERDVLETRELEALRSETPLLYAHDGQPLPASSQWGGHEVWMTLDLDQEIVGWKAKKHYVPLDLQKVRGHDPRDYFEPLARPKGQALFLSREAFYIFSTAERVVVPPEYAVEMLPYDTSAGEFRAHYAGFFDPGFGWPTEGPVRGAPAVLEVRPYEDDLLVRHRQPVCRMAYERLTQTPDRLYGVGSHYAAQEGPHLSKLFEVSPC